MNKLTYVLLSGVCLSSCAGYDRALLATKTNVGLDIDSTPPTAEVTIARRELALQPTFPDRPPNVNTNQVAGTNDTNGSQNTLPVLAAFGLQGNFFNPRITGYFAGGAAAVALADGNDANQDDSLCLQNQPEDTRSPLKRFWHNLIGVSKTEAEREVRPFYFAADTMYGLKAAWTGTGGPYPDTLKIGYNRKEFASAPIFVNQGCNQSQKGQWNVKLPAFLASVDNASGMEIFEESSIRHVQFFATGSAAKAFAQRPGVRQVAYEEMAPSAAALESSELNAYLYSVIETDFAKANPDKQSAAVEAAKSMKLVPDSTNTDSLLTELRKTLATGSALVSKNLNSLRQIVAP